MPGESMDVGAKYQGNAAECLGNEMEWVQSAWQMQESRGMPDKCKGVLNVPGQCKDGWKLVQRSRGKQGNAM